MCLGGLCGAASDTLLFAGILVGELNYIRFAAHICIVQFSEKHLSEFAENAVPD
jgi:hypothetical protein